MGTRRQQAIITSGLDDRIPSLATRHLLTHIARISDDRWKADHPLCCRLAHLAHITKLDKRTIKTSLRALDQQDIIRLTPYERRYNPKYNIIIIDPAYIDALELLRRERASEQAQPDPLPLVKEREIHSHGKEREIHSPNGKEREILSPNGKEREIPSHSRPKGSDLKGSTSYKEPTAGDPKPSQVFVDSGQVNGSQNGSHPDPEITAPPPAVTAHPARSHDRPGDGPDDLWDRVLHELELQLPETTFETWVRDTSIISHTEGKFIIDAPHAYARNWLRHHLQNKVKTILNQLTQQTVEVSFEVRGKPQPAQAAEEADPPDTFRQAKDAEIEYRQDQIENGNSHRRRRKPQRKTIHPRTPEQVPQQNGQHASP